MPELVSCVMATGNRPEFLRQAVRCFLRQTYRPAELIIVDDGKGAGVDLGAGQDRVHHIRLERPTPTGAKLNLGIEHARGAILQKLDDDDYYHPDFLKTAMAHRPARDPRALVAWDCFLVWIAGEKQMRDSGHGWTAGGTFCFPRKLWERVKFRDVQFDEDYWFLRDARPRVVPVCAPEQYLLVRHGRNTWTAMSDGERADDFLRELPVYPKPFSTLVDRPAQAFYRTLNRATAARLQPSRRSRSARPG
jgi:glycosyltransferase involved in cell wall biosynthesis